MGKEFKVSLAAGRSVALKFDGQNVLVREKGKTVSFPTLACGGDWGGSPSFHRVVLVDANFDGVKDLAVMSSEGYGGINVFYQLYLTGKNGGFKKSAAEPVMMWPENVVYTAALTDPETQTLTYTAKDGARHDSTTLCLRPDKSDLFLCRSGQQSPVDKYDEYDFTWYDSAGRRLLTRYAESSSYHHSAEVFIVLRKSHFVPTFGGQPGRAYVVAGDIVEVFQLRGDWAFVSYHNAKGKRTVGWLPRSDLK